MVVGGRVNDGTGYRWLWLVIALPGYHTESAVEIASDYMQCGNSAVSKLKVLSMNGVATFGDLK